MKSLRRTGSIREAFESPVYKESEALYILTHKTHTHTHTLGQFC